MAYIAPLLMYAVKTGLRRYAEDVMADHDGVPEQTQVPGPDPRNQLAVDRMRAGLRMAFWHDGIPEVHSLRCNGELAVRFSREVARFGSALPAMFVRTAYTFVRTDGDVGDLHEWVPWMAHCWGRLMSLMPDAVLPPVKYLTELPLPILRTAADAGYVQTADAQHRVAIDAAAYYYGKSADKKARREGAGAAPRPVPPYERPEFSSRPKPDRVGQSLTHLLTEGDCVAGNQARKEVNVRACQGDDVAYLMPAGQHAKRLSGGGWRRVPSAVDDLEQPRGFHVAYPTVLLYYYDRMMVDDRTCLQDMSGVERMQLTAITLLADVSGGRVHRDSLALLHRLERLPLDDMVAGNTDEHALLQRLLQGMAVKLPDNRCGGGRGLAVRADAVSRAGRPRGEPTRVLTSDGRLRRRLQKSGRARDVDERSGADAAGGGSRRGGGSHPERRQRRGP